MSRNPVRRVSPRFDIKRVWGGLSTTFRIAFRVLSYAALLVVGVALGTISYLLSSGGCSRIDTGSVLCTEASTQEIANFALSVALITAFTGIPAVLAQAGVLYLARDIWRLIRRIFRRGA